MYVISKRSLKRGKPLAVLGLGMAALVACGDPGRQMPLDVEAPPTAVSFSSAEVPTGLASIAWQTYARTAVAAHNTSPTNASRAYALLSVAQYGAAVDATAVPATGSENDGFGAGGRSQFERVRGAIAGASAQVLSFLFTDVAAVVEQRVIDEGNAGPGDVHPQFTEGVALGRATGNTMIAWARADRFNAPWTGSIPSGAGMWIPNGPPAGPMIPFAEAYFLSSNSQFRPVPPPAFGSAAFLTSLDEIKTIALTRTAAQLAAAISWNQSTGTATTLGFWNQLAEQYSLEHGFGELATTHVLALTDAAVVDAIIGCWDAKYFYNLIRPSQATTGITLPIGLPNHPSYPSGHSCVSSSAATVIASFFPEHAAELSALVIQAGLSRMYGGLHYDFDVSAGQLLGATVAQFAIGIDQATGLLSQVR